MYVNCAKLQTKHFNWQEIDNNTHFLIIENGHYYMEYHCWLRKKTICNVITVSSQGIKYIRLSINKFLCRLSTI